MHDGDKIGKAATGKLIRTKNRRDSSEIRSLQEVSGSHEYRKKKWRHILTYVTHASKIIYIRFCEMSGLSYHQTQRVDQRTAPVFERKAPSSGVFCFRLNKGPTHMSSSSPR